MPDEETIREVAKATRAASENLPVKEIYRDALQPGARQVGKGLETILKAVNASLAPLKAYVWAWEKAASWITVQVAKRLKDVPQERLITPAPNVAVPAMIALTYTGEIPPLAELYANLLATSMDKNSASQAHPGFVDIIRQLTPDEARVVGLFAVKPAFPLLTLYAGSHSEHNHVLSHFSLLGEEAGCERQELMPSFLENMSRLGLCEIREDIRISDASIYERLKEQPRILDEVSRLERQGQNPGFHEEALFVTNFGSQFCEACVAQHQEA